MEGNGSEEGGRQENGGNRNWMMKQKLVSGFYQEGLSRQERRLVFLAEEMRSKGGEAQGPGQPQRLEGALMVAPRSSDVGGVREAGTRHGAR